MDRLLQFAVIIAIASNTHSYKIQQQDPEVLEIPEEPSLDDFYPTEYIDQLVKSLSPEKLERIRTVIDLHHRDGTPSSSRCTWYSHKFSPKVAPDEYGTDYFIIHHKDLPNVEFSADVCRYESGYHCQKDEYNDRPTYASCCQQVMDKVTTNVLSEPVKEYLKRENKTTSDADIIQKDIYLNSRCECSEKYLDSHDLLNPNDVCKSKGQ